MPLSSTRSTSGERARLLDATEAAWYLNVTPRWIRSAWGQRKLPAVKVGRAVRFRVEDLDAYVEAQRVGATAAPKPEPAQ
jgi:excisionase family DNA binding protein